MPTTVTLAVTAPQTGVQVTRHRITASSPDAVVQGDVRWSPLKSLWFFAMAGTAVVGGLLHLHWQPVLLFVVSTALGLLLGHSLGSHRKLIHNSFACPRWLEYVLVYMGTLVGLAGPLGLLRQHELRDWGQRQPQCHAYLSQQGGFWRDAWWQLHCELHLHRPPTLTIEDRIANNRFYQWLDRTWMWQQLPVALVLYALGSWAFVVWGVCARVTAGVTGHWLIGWFAHNHGAMHYTVEGAAVQGRNLPFLSLLTMGECWHNNHHAYPGSARLALQTGQWDPGWWVLLGLQKVGLVWSLVLPQDLPPRAELRVVGSVEP